MLKGEIVFRIAVVIASRGRPEVLARTTLSSLGEQSRPADEVVLSLTSETDLPDLNGTGKYNIVYGSAGLSRQRNQGTAALSTVPDVVAYLDDDLILHSDYLAHMERHFLERSNLVLAMGHLLANGGIMEDAARSLAAAPPDLGQHADKYYATSHKWGHVYGANMCVRGKFALQEPFDERLPLYSLMEDVDFGTRCRRAGEVGYSYCALAVHLRAPSGRINNRQLGFSEVMNPAYLAAKGTVPITALPRFIIRTPAVNFTRGLLPSNSRDRHRFYGNAIAMLRLARGRTDPAFPAIL